MKIFATMVLFARRIIFFMGVKNLQNKKQKTYKKLYMYIYESYIYLDRLINKKNLPTEGKG